MLFPQVGIKRADVMRYYAEVAPYLLQQARDRALTITRYPKGVPGPMFYQKHPAPDQPLTVSTADELLYWVGRGALEWHAPLGTMSRPLCHDWAVLDLDPSPGASWRSVQTVARVVKTLLDLEQVPFLLKTSGQRGLHFYVAIRPLDHRLVTRVVEQWARFVIHTVPDLATIARLKRDRGPRVYLDYLQNGHTRTTVMAYSLRATPTATVSTPILWDDLLHAPDYWTMERVLRAIRRHGNRFQWPGQPVDLGYAARRYGLSPGGTR